MTERMAYMENANRNETGMIYGAYLNSYGSWTIQTRNVNMYLIVGNKKAMLIDTGYGEGDLPEIIRNITNLPVVVVNTHGHYDHTSGNPFFEKVWMGKGGEEPALECESRNSLPYPNYEISNLEDGQIFDLGGASVEAIAIGAHHCSSFAFLHKESRTLYTGDELESGQVLLCVSGENEKPEVFVQRHMNNMIKLKGRSGEFDRLAPAHNGGPLDNSYIDDFIELSKRLIDGTADVADTCAGFGWPNTIFGGDEALKRVSYKKASFVLSRY